MATRRWSGPSGAEGRGMEKRDVEKRWSDPGEFRKAAEFMITVTGVALVALLLIALPVGRQAGPGSLVFAPAAVFLIGGVMAFVQAYRVWKRGGVWPIWQGVGWILMVLMLLCLGFGAGAYSQE